VIEEALEETPLLPASIAGELASHADLALPGIPGRGAQDASYHLVEGPAAGELDKGAGQGLPVIGEDVEIVLELGQAPEDPYELADGVVDMMEGASG
jgi:hypothetical protein